MPHLSAAKHAALFGSRLKQHYIRMQAGLRSTRSVELALQSVESERMAAKSA